MSLAFSFPSSLTVIKAGFLVYAWLILSPLGGSFSIHTFIVRIKKVLLVLKDLSLEKHLTRTAVQMFEEHIL